MSFSQATYDAVFGGAWHTNGKDIKTLLVYAEYAGNPTNNVTPDFIGQECLDTTNSAWYKSTGLLPANWVKLSP